MYNLTNINLKWQFIKDVLLDAASRFVPISKPKSHCRPNWFNTEVQYKLNCIHTIRRKTKARPTTHNTAKLKAAEESLSLTMENAKRSYEASLVQSFSSTKSNKIYKYISALKSNDQIPLCIYLNNTTVTTDEERPKTT